MFLFEHCKGGCFCSLSLRTFPLEASLGVCIRILHSSEKGLQSNPDCIHCLPCSDLCNQIIYIRNALCHFFRKDVSLVEDKGPEESGEEEIFFGAVGFTEKCVAKNVTDIIEEENKVKVIYISIF